MRKLGLALAAMTAGMGRLFTPTPTTPDVPQLKVPKSLVSVDHHGHKERAVTKRIRKGEKLRRGVWYVG